MKKIKIHLSLDSMGCLKLDYYEDLQVRTCVPMLSGEVNIVQLWHSVDPLAEMQPDKTPYHFCSNNPINRTDPTGMLDGDYFDRNGNHLGNDGVDDKKIYVLNEGRNAKFDNKDVNWGGKLDQKHVDEIKGHSKELDLNSDTGKLSRIIFAEARGEKRIEKEAVADVIKNRVESDKFPDTFEGVIKQPYQFSSLLPNDPNKAFYDNPLSKTDNKTNNSAWLDGVGAAIKTMNSNQSITNGSLLYYSPDSMRPKGATPNWNFNKLQEVKVDGARTNRFKFYKDK